MRRIGVVTVARSDYGIYRPILRRIHTDPDLLLQVYVGGMHLSPEFGSTVAEIERDGFPIVDRIEMLLSSDSPDGIAKSIGLGTVGFAQAFARARPDLMVVLGDRFEMLAAAIAALPCKIPLAHIHGGESTEGAIDDAIRACLTKLSHLHFVSTENYRTRVIELGEAPWRVQVTGAPALDNLTEVASFDPAELTARLGFPITPPPLLVTFHPVTLEFEDTAEHVRQLLTALHRLPHPVVFTYPNADTHGRIIIRAINRYVADHANAHVVPSMGIEVYFSLMRHAAAMVGNSSSGIIEAASFRLPVVNVGNRQGGRLRGRNVVDVPCVAAAIEEAVGHVIAPAFRRSLDGFSNPYGDGRAAARIVDALKTCALGRDLLVKKSGEALAAADV